jgi:tetratricopeptide (TPR) repeat protein
MAFNPHSRFLLCLVFASSLAGTVVSLEAAPQGEPQAAAQDEVSLDNLVRQCDEAWQHGRWVDAKKLCLAVLERADQLPDSNPKKARVLFQVVPIYYRSDEDKPQAINLLQRILAIDETALGPEDPQVALDLRELGIQQQFLKPADAEKSFKRAVTIAEGARQMSSALRMGVFVGAAQFYRSRERYQEAEALLRQALELGDTLPPRQRNTVLNVRADLAATLRKEGKNDEADLLLAGPVPPGPAANGDEPTPDWTSAYNDFIRARQYKDQNRLQDAELHYRLALSALDRFPASTVRPFPEDMALDELADICHAQHRDAEAEDLLLRALHLRERKVNEQDPKINPNLAMMLSAPYALQNFYRDQGRLSEIEPVYKRAIEIQERYYGLTDDPVSDTLRNLASVYVEEKKIGEALPLYRHVLQIKERTLGANDPKLVSILESLANALQELGRTAEADKMRARAKRLSIQRTRNLR